MIRQDYLLRMIQDFFAMLSRLSALKREQQWEAAAGTLDEELKRLAGDGAQSLAGLSETELLARLIQGEPTQVVQQKVLMLATLFSEAGEIAAAEHRSDESRAFYLKGLRLLLDTLAQEEILECPAFVPKAEAFVRALSDQPLPLAIQARLMQHYERTGDFAKAEDALFAMLDSEPEQPGLAEFGVAFYQRLQSKSDAALNAGNLPRPELEASLQELRQLISS